MEIQSSNQVSTKLRRIAELAKRAPDMSFTSLSHHIDLEWLREAFRRTRKDGAPGIDGTTAAGYADNLDDNLQDLLNRAKSGRYRAPAVRRVHIPKGKGRTRPIGVPTFEDKVLQRAVVMVLEPVYEGIFLDCSYGFRPKRSAHQALNALWVETMKMGGGWVVEVDIKGYFDAIPHDMLREVLRQRVRDGVILRLIGKWLNAGVLENGQISYPGAGSPQGGVISPLLANAYLHEVMDTWFENTVKPRLRGKSVPFRFADDLLVGFSLESDARRFLKVIPKRLARYGLEIHPDKTRLVNFRRPSGKGRGNAVKGSERPGTFSFLGFTHYWGLSRKGNWVIRRKTAKDRFSKAINAIRVWCRRARHLPIKEQRDTLARKLLGHYAYYGITWNNEGVARFYRECTRVWFKWLTRRSNRHSTTWDDFNRLLKRLKLPLPRIVHSFVPHAAKP